MEDEGIFWMEVDQKDVVVADKSQVKLDLSADEIAQATATEETKMYDIDDPPEVGEQFAMFPDRGMGNDNLAYFLFKMEGSSDDVPVVFCLDCLAPKYIRYCNGVWEYRYEPCGMDKDL